MVSTLLISICSYELQAVGAAAGAGAPASHPGLVRRLINRLRRVPNRVQPAPIVTNEPKGPEGTSGDDGRWARPRAEDQRRSPSASSDEGETVGIIPMGHQREPGGVEAYFHHPQITRSASGHRFFVEQPVNRVLRGRPMDTKDVHQFRVGSVPKGEIRESHGTVYPGGVYVGVEQREGQNPKMISGGQVPLLPSLGAKPARK